MKILAVDDDVKIREVLSEMLSLFGYENRTATNGAEALNLLKEDDFPVVISDIRMPGMDGIELLQKIKKNTPDTEVIIITGFSDRYSFTDVIKAGAVDFISKPFQKDELEAKISRIIKERTLKHELKRKSEGYRKKSETLELVNKELAEALKELKATQSYLLQSEKMASVGQLAAGVAHEINNPTGFVHSNLGSLNKYSLRLLELMRKYEEGIHALKNNGHRDITPFCEELEELKKKLKIDFIMKDFQKVITDSLEGTERIKKIVADLKSFSHVDQAEFKQADINEGIESTLNVVWNELKYKCTVEKDYGDLPKLYCNLGQLNQVFANLFVNASHAIEEKGVIRIATRYVNGKSADSNEGHGHIEVIISDTGSGIPEDKVTRIFEPFFTTKEVGKGTGLGLSIAYDIIKKKHNGEIGVKSAVGEGTTFTITLPLTENRGDNNA